MKHSNRKLYTPCKTRSLKVKEFVAGFDFPEPDWERLPEGFPKLDKQGLTKEEGYLLDGIKLAWTVSEGRGFFYKRTAKRVVIGLSIAIIILAGTTLLGSYDKTLSKSVNAKTVTTAVGEIVEATMSAVFKKQ